jgi:hypothetical protein
VCVWASKSVHCEHNIAKDRDWLAHTHTCTYLHLQHPLLDRRDQEAESYDGHWDRMMWVVMLCDVGSVSKCCGEVWCNV